MPTLVIRYVRVDVPICPCHGPDHNEPMKMYSCHGRTKYFKCLQEGCEFRAKTVRQIVEALLPRSKRQSG